MNGANRSQRIARPGTFTFRPRRDRTAAALVIFTGAAAVSCIALLVLGIGLVTR